MQLVAYHSIKQCPGKAKRGKGPRFKVTFDRLTRHVFFDIMHTIRLDLSFLPKERLLGQSRDRPRFQSLEPLAHTNFEEPAQPLSSRRERLTET